LVRSVARHAGTAIFLSSLVWVEFSHVVVRERFRTRLFAERARQFDLAHWDQPEVRELYLESLLSDLEALLVQFGWTEIPLTRAVRQLATRNIVRYNLGPHDAVHLASATEAGITNFASLDRGYRRVEGLHLWNDRIHSPSTG
jgi:predicted nucleic acid-binding protein